MSKKGIDSSYWQDEGPGAQPPAYQEPYYGRRQPQSSYYSQPASDASDVSYYEDAPQDDAEFLARQADASGGVYRKDHVAAALFAIFLGAFGIHKFYLGYNQAGFIMLAVTVVGGILSLGLAAAVVEVIAIIEGVIYLTKSQSEFDAMYVTGQHDWF